MENTSDNSTERPKMNKKAASTAGQSQQNLALWEQRFSKTLYLAFKTEMAGASVDVSRLDASEFKARLAAWLNWLFEGINDSSKELAAKPVRPRKKKPTPKLKSFNVVLKNQDGAQVLASGETIKGIIRARMRLAKTHDPAFLYICGPNGEDYMIERCVDGLTLTYASDIFDDCPEYRKTVDEEPTEPTTSGDHTDGPICSKASGDGQVQARPAHDNPYDAASTNEADEDQAEEEGPNEAKSPIAGRPVGGPQ